MPPILALTLCTIFVFFLLRLDKRQAPGMSAALWVPTIWVISCACKPLAKLFGFGESEVGGSGVEAGSPVDRAFSTILIVCSLMILARRRLNWSKVFKDNAWLFLLFSFMALSIIWSDFQFVSFKRWIRACGSILMALVILSESAPSRALESVFRRSTYVLIPFSLLLVKYFSKIGHEYNRWSGEMMWVGVTPQKNCLGRVCLISGFFLIWEFIRRWRQREIRTARHQIFANVVVLVMTLWLLIGSSSATSLAVLLLGVATFLGLRLIRERLKSNESLVEWAAVALVIVLGVGYQLFGDLLLESAFGALGRDTTLTGRTDIWSTLWSIAMQHPVVGKGYGSFWIQPPEKWERFNEAHNGYLDVFLELGIVGLLLLAGFLVSFYWRSRKALSLNFDRAGFNICFLLMAMIHNLTESSFVQSATHLWTVIIFLAILSSALYEAERNACVNPAISSLARAESEVGSEIKAAQQGARGSHRGAKAGYQVEGVAHG